MGVERGTVPGTVEQRRLEIVKNVGYSAAPRTPVGIIIVRRVCSRALWKVFSAFFKNVVWLCELVFTTFDFRSLVNRSEHAGAP